MAEEDKEEAPTRVMRDRSSIREKKRLPGHKRLTSTEAKNIVEYWKSGSMTLKDLAKKYGVSTVTIQNHIKKAGAKKGESADKVQSMVQQELEKNAADEAIQIANRIRETKEEHYRMAAGISKLLWKTVVDNKKENKPLTGNVAVEIKSYKTALEALRIARIERYAILNVKEQEEIDKPIEMPKLVIQELTAEDVKRLNEAQRVQFDDGEIPFEEGIITEDNISDMDKVAEGEDEE